MHAKQHQRGHQADLFNFCERVGKEHMNKRTLESLIKVGAFDGINPNRAMLLANIDLGQIGVIGISFPILICIGN